MRFALAAGEVERERVELRAKARVLFAERAARLCVSRRSFSRLSHRRVLRGVLQGGGVQRRRASLELLEGADEVAHHLIAPRELDLERPHGAGTLAERPFEIGELLGLRVAALRELLLEHRDAPLGAVGAERHLFHLRRRDPPGLGGRAHLFDLRRQLGELATATGEGALELCGVRGAGTERLFERGHRAGRPRAFGETATQVLELAGEELGSKLGLRERLAVGRPRRVRDGPLGGSIALALDRSGPMALSLGHLGPVAFGDLGPVAFGRLGAVRLCTEASVGRRGRSQLHDGVGLEPRAVLARDDDERLGRPAALAELRVDVHARRVFVVAELDERHAVERKLRDHPDAVELGRDRDRRGRSSRTSVSPAASPRDRPRRSWRR